MTQTTSTLNGMTPRRLRTSQGMASPSAAAAVFDDPARPEEDDLFARDEYRTIMIGPYPHHFRPTGERKRTQDL